MKHISILLFLAIITISCSGRDSTIAKKGFQVSEITENDNGKKIIGLNIDSLKLETIPKNVLLTKYAEHRLTPIYKINYTKKQKKPYSGSNNYHTKWNPNNTEGNNWNNNYMPGFKAVYGYNFVNVSHFNNTTKTENKLFEMPVLIKTLY